MKLSMTSWPPAWVKSPDWLSIMVPFGVIRHDGIETFGTADRRAGADAAFEDEDVGICACKVLGQPFASGFRLRRSCRCRLRWCRGRRERRRCGQRSVRGYRRSCASASTVSQPALWMGGDADEIKVLLDEAADSFQLDDVIVVRVYEGQLKAVVCGETWP